MLPLLLLLAQIPAIEGTAVDAATLRWIEVAPGTGAPATPGKEFAVHYTGWLRDGTKFDSSRDRNEPIRFVQGRRQVIPGWDAGFEGMRVGGKRRLIIPYQFAYGEAGRGAIPPKAELTFDVELMAVNEPPVRSAAADVLDPFEDAASKILQLARAIPADKFAWRPSPGTRTVAEVCLHVAQGNRLMTDLAGKSFQGDELQKRVAESAAGEKQTLSKEQLLQRIEESFGVVRKSLENVTPANLGRDIVFFDKPSSRRGVYVYLDTHLAEHLGQLIAYARSLGIRPPWSN